MSGPWLRFQAPEVAAPEAAPAAPVGPWLQFQQAAPPVEQPPAEDPNARASFNYARPVRSMQGDPQQEMQRDDDIIRRVADGASFGFADRLAGAMTGTGAEEQRRLTAEAGQRLGRGAIAADLAGGVGSAVGAARMGLTAARAIPQAWNTGLRGLGLRTGAAAADGAAMGALSGVGHGTDPATGAAIGAAAGGVGNLAIAEPVRAIARGVGGAFNRAPEPPTTQQLRQQGQAAYQAADDAGVIIRPEAIQRLRQSVVDDLTQQGYHPRLQPGVAAVLDELDRVGSQNMTLQGAEVLRRVVGGLRGGNESERRLGSRIISQIDDWSNRLAPEDVLTGNAQAGTQALREARDLWGRARRAEAIDDAVERATRRADSTGAGGNTDNAIRQNIRGILDSRRRSQGFSPDEREAMDTVVRGTPGQNALRLAGKLSPSGNGLMAALGLAAAGAGGSVAGLPGAAIAAAPAVIGMGAKTLADGATRRNVEMLSRLVRGGGDAAAMTPAPNLLQRAAEPTRALLARLLASGAALSPPVVSPVQ